MAIFEVYFWLKIHFLFISKSDLLDIGKRLYLVTIVLFYQA